MPEIAHADKIHRLARKGDVEAVEKLLAQGVSINAKDGDGQTSLFIAAKFGRTELVEYLIKNGADLTSSSHVLFSLSSVIQIEVTAPCILLLEAAYKR